MACMENLVSEGYRDINKTIVCLYGKKSIINCSFCYFTPSSERSVSYIVKLIKQSHSQLSLKLMEIFFCYRVAKVPAVVFISLTQNNLRDENLNINQYLVMEKTQFGGKGECTHTLIIVGIGTFRKCKIYSASV